MLIERLEWMAAGVVIGFVLGYIVRKRREINERSNTMDHAETKQERMKIMRQRAVGNVALLVVVLITLYAAILSQNASNRSNDTSDRVIQLQHDQKQNLDCTTQILFDAINALNERTTYSTAQADSNIKLIQGQLNFLTQLLTTPPLSDAEARRVFQTYTDNVTRFLELAKKTRQQQIQNPYPTVEDLTSCLTATPTPLQGSS